MANTYRSVPTRYGRARLADALQSGTPVGLRWMALGDGNGSIVSPNENMKSLVNEVYRAEINEIERIDDNTVRIALRVPSEIGGFTVREVGLFDDDGKLVAVGNYADTYKPTPDDGAVRELYVRMWLKMSNVDQVTITVDTSIIYATKEWVAARIADHAGSRDHPDATTEAKGFIELATQEEVDAGSDDRRGVVPRTLKAFIDKVLAAYATVKQLTDHAASRDHPAATTNAQGMVELATYAETKEGSDNARAVTPAGNKSALDAHRTETGAHAATRISTDGLTKLGSPTTVQNALVALDAAFRDAGNLSAGTLPRARLSGSYDIDITGDAKTLRGLGPADFVTSSFGTAINLRHDAYTSWLDYDERGDANQGIRSYVRDGVLRLLPAPNESHPIKLAIGASDAIAWHSGNDGAGSGLDADTVDGIQGNQLLRNTDDVMNGTLTVNKGILLGAPTAGQTLIRLITDSSRAWFQFYNRDDVDEARTLIFSGYGGASLADDGLQVKHGGSYRKVWHQGNDGAGSGLDADTLDGKHASEFPTLSGDNTLSGIQQFLGTTRWAVSSSNSAVQRADARADGELARLHWYGKDANGSTANFRHAWYDGSRYVNVSAEDGGVVLDGQRVWMTLKPPSTGDNALSQGAGISIGEGGRTEGGGAAVHLTYVGNGNGYLGMGRVGDDGIPEYCALKMYYRSQDAEFQGTVSAPNMKVDGNSVWHTGNDGMGSGLDADKLDGWHGIEYRNASNLNAGTVPTARLSGTYSINISGTAGNAESFAGRDPAFYRNASNLDGGVIPTARLGQSGGERDWVLGRTASAAVGAVGSYAMLMAGGGANLQNKQPGTLFAGNMLLWSSAGVSSASNPAGTWMLMGWLEDANANDTNSVSLFLRVS